MKTMPNNEIEERYRWIAPILKGEISIKDAVKICPFSERTIKYWLAHFREDGLSGLISKSKAPHFCPWTTPRETREKVIELRKTYHIGGKKIFWKMRKQGFGVKERTVNKILKEEGLERRYRKKRSPEEIYQPHIFLTPGEMVEIDVKYGVRLAKHRWWYQFTAKDKASRWRLLAGFDEQSNYCAINFLTGLLYQAPFAIQAIKTDNGLIFTNRTTGYAKSTDPTKPRYHAFDLKCLARTITHYLIDPGKPQQNGAVENSHSLDQRIFYNYLKKPNNLEEYQYELKLWNMWYNDLENCALNGLTPNEYLYLSRVQNVRA
ncbi:MAG: helix-turn-helix domain-containing protein [Candidatus Doudnabacteria bacterium]